MYDIELLKFLLGNKKNRLYFLKKYLPLHRFLKYKKVCDVHTGYTFINMINLIRKKQK